MDDCEAEDTRLQRMRRKNTVREEEGRKEKL
jgi:hypothetical protein